MNGPLSAAGRERLARARRYRCISSRHDSVSSFVFVVGNGEEAENQISRRPPPSPLPPSHGRQSRLIVKVPNDRANEVAYPTKRTRERANERVGVFRRMSHCLLSLSLPIGKGRETARGGTTTECRVPTEECLPSISAAAAASSPFLDTSYSTARWLHSRSVCPISAKSSNFLVPSGDKQLELMSTMMSALQIILGGRDPTSSVRGTSFPHFLARH